MTLQGLLLQGVGEAEPLWSPHQGKEGCGAAHGCELGWVGSERDGNPALPPFAHPGCCQASIWDFPFAFSAAHSGMGLIFSSAS